MLKFLVEQQRVIDEVLKVRHFRQTIWLETNFSRNTKEETTDFSWIWKKNQKLSKNAFCKRIRESKKSAANNFSIPNSMG